MRHKRAGYYITKDFAEHAMNEKRYWTSHGVVVPEVIPIDHYVERSG
nr:hypothetical protein [Burkholderia ubonensis]